MASRLLAYRAQSPHMGGVAAIQKVNPDTAVDNDHLAPRLVRLRPRLPRQRYLPKAPSTSCWRRSLIINLSASSTVCFLVACPEAFWASRMRTSSISILVRVGRHIPYRVYQYIPYRVYQYMILYTLGPRPATTERKVIVLQADLYTRKAREERRLVRDLLRLSRALVKTLT